PANNDNFNVIMQHYCSVIEPPEHCPPYPPLPSAPTGTTGTVCINGLTGCSRFNATNQQGICANWASRNRDLATNLQHNFCNNNICASDCQCYNAVNVDPVYRFLFESN